MPLPRTPLAWKNLTHDRRRLMVAIGGILFAVLLMFIEVGFMFALFDSTVKILDDMKADIVLVSSARYALPAERRIEQLKVDRARSCRGVASVYPIYIERSSATLCPLPFGKGYPIRVIGYPLGADVFRSPAIAEHARELSEPNTAIIDSQSKQPGFEFAVGGLERSDRVSAELSGRRIQLVGTFPMGTDFANDGNLIMSGRNFANYFPWRGGGDPLSVVDLALVQIDPDADVQSVRDRIDELLGDDVTVLATDAYRAREILFWRENTPIGLIFQMGVLLGFIVGIIICYQVIYTDISDHMSEFATLKAMGYTTRYFVRLVIGEALCLSLLGFVPGLALATAIYFGLAKATGLLMVITPTRAAAVLLLTFIMCVVSGLLALRKLLAADPAELF